jgi:hypothetical protein
MNLASMKLGDSIVRDCAIHDLQHFSIAQDISLYVDCCGKGWFGMFLLDDQARLQKLTLQ